MLEHSAAAPTLIQSLQRGMHLVAAVIEHGPLTARALSGTTGIVLPTTYHLLRTLVHEGYLHRSPGGRYFLGDQLTSITQLERRAHSLRLVREEMTELANRARATVSIGVVHGTEIVISQLATHPVAPRFDCWPGMTIPGHATAIGKNILSRMAPEHRLEYLAAHPMESLTSHTPTTMWSLEKELAESGTAHSDQQFRYGITCAAASVAGYGKLAALGAAFATTRCQRLRNQIDDLVETAAVRISDAIGLAGADFSRNFDEIVAGSAAI